MLDYLDEKYRRRLVLARESQLGRIINNPVGTALSVYDGWLYRVLNRELIRQAFLQGVIDFTIISAGYGFVNGFELIGIYDIEMNATVKKFWVNAGLLEIIGNYAGNIAAEVVIGFFAYKTKYREIFEEVPWPSNIKKAILYTSTCTSISTTLMSIGEAISIITDRILRGEDILETIDTSHCIVETV